MSLEAREDFDPVETTEWLDSLESVVDREGEERARYLLTRLADRLRRDGVQAPFSVTTPHRNTIPVHREAPMPGDLFMERRIRSLIRYNAIAQVIRNNRANPGLGGHIASFMSAATLYDVGFNHFFRAPNGDFEGDLVYIQGHVAPGVYARAYLEGRLTEEQMDKYRQEVDGDGLSSYPHPWLMPDFWQFPTVSMGLGPIQAIYQAHVMKYLDSRELRDMHDRKIWCFMGDGECDEPESLGAIHLASREKLDNLIFVINCNLQRLDGPVRGNSRIMDELEGVFRGAGWNVQKVVWGRLWDPLFEKDKKGILQKRMDEAVDGEYQNYKANGGAYTREHFFGKYPETAEMVKDMSDEDIWRLNRGGHDPFKVYAAYHEAVNNPNGRPTVILAHTVKGYGMGSGDGEAANEAHQVKTMEYEALKKFRDRFGIPLSDEQLKDVPYYKPADDSPSSSTCTCSASAWAAIRRAGAATSRRCRFPTSTTRLSRRRWAAPRGARSPAPWPSCGFSTAWSRTSRSASRWCPSCPTRRAPSAWRGCSASWVSTPPKARSTSPSTRARSCSTARTSRARSSRRASRRRAPCRRGSPRPPPTATTTCRCCRSTSTTRCSASSVSATWPGRPVTCRRAASWWAALPVAPRSTARGCSTRTVIATCRPRPFPTVAATTPPMPTRWR